MQIPPERTAEVKQWVIKKLEDISDADSDVLADYVLALISSDEPDDKIRANCVENLEDFLKENTGRFVDEIFVKYGPPVKHVLPPRPPLPPHPGAQGPARSAVEGLRSGRKRTFEEVNDAPPRGQRGGRLSKMHKRSANGRPSMRSDGRMPHSGFSKQVPLNGPTILQSSALFPSPFPAFDSSDPMSMVMAMQAMMQMSGMMGANQVGDIMPNGILPQNSTQRCQDWDTKGFCSRGITCLYQHGSESARPNIPKSPVVQRHGGRASVNGHESNRVGGNGSTHRKRSRADFSDPNPNYDKSITTIAVEHIPQDHFEQGKVREFFSQFGHIVEIKMKSHRLLALIKYDDYASARRAFQSPKVIFDNRFVKVYWYKPGMDHKTVGPSTDASQEISMEDVDDEVKIEPEVFARQQEQAQKAHEERLERIKATMEARQKLLKLQKEILERREAEKKKLSARIAASYSKKRTDDGEHHSFIIDGKEGPDAKSAEKEKVEKALREQLAILEAEAKSLGIDPDAPEPPYSSPVSTYTRGRGGYRGHFSTRGAYGGRGRGASFANMRRYTGSVLRLDNRPKRITISLPGDNSFDPRREEALRQYLMSVGEYESIDPDPDNPNGGMTIGYKERYHAEMLVAGGRNIPGIGIVDMKWVSGNAAAMPKKIPEEDSKRRVGRGDDEDEDLDGGDEVMKDYGREVVNGSGNEMGELNGHHSADVDYDVADEDDWNLIT